MSMIESGLSRIRTAPPLVRWLTQQQGAWVFGSQADFTKMPRDSSDWDIGVSMSVWQAISGMLNSHDIVVTKSGVLRIVQDGKTIELQICDIAEKLTRPFYTCAWHPATNTILVKELT